MPVLTTIALLGCALVAGIFFAFSTFVMRALGRIAPEQGIAAMQAINVVVINRWFLTAFFGTGAACAVLMVWSLARWDAATPWMVAGALLYIVGTIWVTLRFNVPRNNALAAAAPPSPEAAATWATYLSEWTAWNHVRTVAAFAGAVCFSVAGFS